MWRRTRIKLLIPLTLDTYTGKINSRTKLEGGVSNKVGYSNLYLLMFVYICYVVNVLFIFFFVLCSFFKYKSKLLSKLYSINKLIRFCL